MNNLFHLQILTPSGVYFDDQVESIIFDTPTGKLGIQKGYEASAVSISEGILIIKIKNKTLKFYVSVGFAESTIEVVNIFTMDIMTEEEFINKDENKQKQREKESDLRENNTADTLKMQNLIAKTINKLKNNL